MAEVEVKAGQYNFKKKKGGHVRGWLDPNPTASWRGAAGGGAAGSGRALELQFF
jgi:hypothetical protein